MPQRYAIGIGLLLFALLFLMATLTPESFFLHFDNPTQHVHGLELTFNCWGYSAKPAISWILAVVYASLGPDPFWEILVLVGLTATGLAVSFRLAVQALGTPIRAIPAMLWLIALPSFQYYTRNHMAYPATFFILGIWLYTIRRFFLAGLSFGLALLSHFNSVVLIPLWLAASLVAGTGPRMRRDYLLATIGLFAPVVFVEVFQFAYSGIPLQWLRGSLGEIRTYSAVTGTSWGSALEILLKPNGLQGWLLLPGIATLVVRPRRSILWALSCTAWGVMLGYTVRSGLTHMWLPARVIAGIYPLLAVSAVAAWGHLLDATPAMIRRAIMGLAVVGYTTVLVWLGVWLNGYSRTGFPYIAQVFQHDAQGRAVRFFGNMWIGQFYARRFGIETAINDFNWLSRPTDSEAILVMTDPSEILTGKLEHTRYNIQHIKTGHWPGFAPAELDDGDTIPTQIEVWTPLDGMRASVEPVSPGAYTLYYSGKGCLTPPAYDNGTKHFYQLALDRLQKYIPNR